QSAVTAFNPSITRIVSDNLSFNLSEPTYPFADQWVPDQPFAYSVFESGGRRYMQLLVRPAQYKGTEQGGSIRKYATMRLRLNYYNESANPGGARDIIKPVVRDTGRFGQIVTARIEERTGTPALTPRLERVQMLVETASHAWVPVPFTLVQLNDTTWEARATLGTLALSTPFQAMVQAEDGAGNIGTETYRGTLDVPPGPRLFLPIISR
ncbi:MAG TPA: hypothetical protein VGE07_06050, partial [Herpetosiphonaceae bacterium]